MIRVTSHRFYIDLTRAVDAHTSYSLGRYTTIQHSMYNTLDKVREWIQQIQSCDELNRMESRMFDFVPLVAP